MWNVAMAGYMDRLLVMIHDELVYWLYPWEVKEAVPIIEKAMIDGMRMATPDVKITVETTLMRHWDKSKEGTVEYGKLKWDDAGLPVVNETTFVKGIEKEVNNVCS